MKRKLNKFFCLLIAVIIIISLFVNVSVRAETGDFTMKAFDKAYITFVFDDGKMPFSKQSFEIFKGFKMPACYALIANKILTDKETADYFKSVQEAGGEILSHTLTHEVINEDNCAPKLIEKQLGNSYLALTGLGFNVNGVIETGDGGSEATADYEAIEKVSKKYYKYSNAYGVSPQYKKDRIWLGDNTLDSMKAIVDKAINEKEWVVISAHDFTEFSKDNLTKLLEYIESKGKQKAEVVTWNYVYKKFGEYTGPQIPSADIIKSVCKGYGHDLTDTKIKKKATCETNAVEEGKCKRCGEVGTREVPDSAAHKYGEYKVQKQATCQDPAILIAKCTVKGCKATTYKSDNSSMVDHSYRLTTTKEATSEISGLAANKCEYCGKVKNTIIIPKGMTLLDVIEQQDKANGNAESSENESGEDTSENQDIKEESKPDNETSSKEEIKDESEDVSGEEITSSQNKEETVSAEEEKPATLSTILIVVVAIVCLLLWGGIGYFVFVYIKKQKEDI